MENILPFRFSYDRKNLLGLIFLIWIYVPYNEQQLINQVFFWKKETFT